jgi:hypothetical protein
VSKRAFYFGFIESQGHGLIEAGGWRTLQPDRVEGFPWRFVHLDTGLLINGGHRDVVDGKVWWTCSSEPLWIAFVWWDRSGDERGNSNSGFYVQGFDHTDLASAFEYACSAFPKVVARQRRPLVLQP